MIEVPPKATKHSPAPLLSKTDGVPDIELMGQTPGRWRYERDGRSRLPIAFAVAVSVGLHVFFLYGFNKRPAAVRAVEAQATELIQMTMPELEPEKSEEVEELTEAVDEAPAVAVPQLADLPSSVSVSTFVQPLQYTPDINASLSNAKVAQIPVNIGRGRNLAGMGQIFEISQLDRAPSPLMQPAPVFPYSLKSTVSEARVVVEFIVDSNGDVVAPTAVSSTHDGFVENALVGVSKWKFKPGMKAGKRVNTRVRAPINFFVTDDT
jgi:periplasmic protein TonB